MSRSILESNLTSTHNLKENSQMSDDTTQRMPDGPSFEQQVLGRLDAIDARLKTLDTIDARLKAVEEQSERRALDTKPIWERALTEILDVKQELGNVTQELGDVKQELGGVKQELGEVKQSLHNVERKLDVLSRDIVQVRADQGYLESRIEKLETKPTQ